MYQFFEENIIECGKFKCFPPFGELVLFFLTPHFRGSEAVMILQIYYCITGYPVGFLKSANEQ